MKPSKSIQSLEPGQALVSHRWIIGRRRNGELIGARDSCDEPTTLVFHSVEIAITQLIQWLQSPNMRSDFEQRTIPQDIEEFRWMVSILTHQPL